ncbi:MAG: thiamine-phosphate kinase, partial [Limnobacter sp.]|nr:thiamine-phosphate kinase [Limnobacter sp.]
MTGEFDIIRRFFKKPFQHVQPASRGEILLGIGDDCAEMQVPEGHKLLTSQDLLLADRHFFGDGEPSDIGYKSLAVNLSDLAAQGASPLGFSLGLAMESVDPVWLEGFSQGLLEAATQFSCPLVGGDTTRCKPGGGPVVAIQVFGTKPIGSSSLQRNQAKVGDSVWVTGIPGLARLGLLHEAEQRGLLSEFLDPTEADGYSLW